MYALASQSHQRIFTGAVLQTMRIHKAWDARLPDRCFETAVQFSFGVQRFSFSVVLQREIRASREGAQ